MPVEIFKDINFKRATLLRIEQANEIVNDFAAQGFTLTLRQLYYQFVAKGLIPNKQTEYDNLGKIISNARLAGLLDWDAIEDRTRNVNFISSWSNPSDIIESARASYREDLWRDQSFRPEIWVEKEALVGVVEPVASRLRVPHYACRGYTSQSEAYAAGKRFRAFIRDGFTPIVFHLGDHDPSGIDMTRDNSDRLELFAREGVEVRRLALNMDQVRQYNPPPNPAKMTDSRVGRYIELYGESSWELDALAPNVIDKLVADAIMALIDIPKWNAASEEEKRNKEMLRAAAENWPQVETFIENNGFI